MHWPSYFFGALSGCLFFVSFIVMILRWGWRHKVLLTQLIGEIYHVDLMPFIRRVKGLLKVALMESQIESTPPHMIMYIEKALLELEELETHISVATKKYEDYQT
jgi:hypothetical protein